jgi:hypothetical protein
MPRRKRNLVEVPRRPMQTMAEELANELKHSRESGQPVIEEQEFSTGNVRVLVLWDKWDHLSLEDRTAIILRAYELAEESDSRRRIALATGLTFPEAHAAGMLPFRIVPLVRKTDSVTLEQCVEAMIDEGASKLEDPERPPLRFSTEEEANASLRRLATRLPESEPVWAILQEPGRMDARLQMDSE